MNTPLPVVPLHARAWAARLLTTALLLIPVDPLITAQAFPHQQLVRFDRPAASTDFALVNRSRVAAIYLDPAETEQLGSVVDAFASDLQRVSGVRPQILTSLQAPLPDQLVLVGTVGHSAVLDRLIAARRLDVSAIAGKWESAITTVVAHPFPHVTQALVVAGSDRRGAAFALFTLSRQMGVSPWTWWADVPVAHHHLVLVHALQALQPEPSVQYRGIFLNDEDWGLRPWAARTMDPSLHNVGPHTYARIFELLLRLHANSLWPAMHPGTLPFNAVPENARLADRWGIVMGSSHSEALLRNNVGEWNETTDGPWNYQLNRPAINAYWEKRLSENGHYENFYTVGMRGVHDTGLEATGSNQVKARLVEQVMADQRALLARKVNPDVARIPQVIWLYKESLALYRAGMQVPPDVTLGWTDDNYGYIRQLPTPAEQLRPGGSGLYYHVSYWGFPHDYLWLCTTPPALLREELTKAFDHGVRRYWVLNAGDLKPAESDIDYFLQLAWNEPAMERIDQPAFLHRWFAEQFPAAQADAIARVMDHAYQLNFIRRPEFMGFNGYEDGVQRTRFNPLAWSSQPFGQNGARMAAWHQAVKAERSIEDTLPAAYHDAYFELVKYPVEAAAAQNDKFLFADRSFLDAAQHHDAARAHDASQARAAFDRIQSLTAQYNRLGDGKWEGIMSAAPRDRQVFNLPITASQADADKPLPPFWGADPPDSPAPPPTISGFVETQRTVSINATQFSRKYDGTLARWHPLPDLGISPGGSMEYGAPGLLANVPPATAPPSASFPAPGPAHDPHPPWLEYTFTTVSTGDATLTLHLLPTFPLDSDHRLRFALSLDHRPLKTFDLAGSGEWKEGNAPTWEANVLRNSVELTDPLSNLAPGRHTLRLFYQDPGIVFEHLVLTFPGAPPAYPVPPCQFCSNSNGRRPHG